MGAFDNANAWTVGRGARSEACHGLECDPPGVELSGEGRLIDGDDEREVTRHDAMGRPHDARLAREQRHAADRPDPSPLAVDDRPLFALALEEDARSANARMTD